MFKMILKTLLVLSFASAAFAQDASRNSYIKNAVPKYGDHRAGQKTVTTTTQVYKTAAAPQAARTTVQPTEASQTLNRIQSQMPSNRDDQWANYLMRGMALGFEYGQIGADVHAEATYRPSNTNLSLKNTAPAASALGVSAMYARLGRDAIGFSAGGTVLQKIENGTSNQRGFENSGAITFFRPEANILFGHNSGFWGGLGGNLDYFTGDSYVTNAIEQFGFGLQAHTGYVATRHLSFDFGYYASLHKLKSAVLTDQFNYSLNSDKSYMLFTQWSLRGIYLF